MVNFGKYLRENTVATLERYKVHYKDKDDLNTLLIRLYTFWEKYILPRKRVVLISEELAAQLGSFPESVTVAVDKMREWIENGVDINCFQGRGLYGKGNRDYQNMLYGIVHLHLSANKDDLVPIIKKMGSQNQVLIFYMRTSVRRMLTS